MSNKIAKDEKSYMYNCEVVYRHSDKINIIGNEFGDHVTARLNGYAIIPVELYGNLIGVKESIIKQKMEKIEETYRELEGNKNND